MNPLYIVIAVAVIVLIFVIWYISTSNKLNRSVVKIDEALSGIDVALTKRYDVLTKMIDVVKSYAKHEKETLFEVIKSFFNPEFGPPGLLEKLKISILPR